MSFQVALKRYDLIWKITYFEIEVGIKHLLTDVTAESFYSTMDLNVLVQISSLCEAEVAVRNRAHIGSFICMDSQMVEEIVPFSKPFVTSFMVAFKDLNVSLRPRVFIGKDTKLFRIRNMLFYLN